MRAVWPGYVALGLAVVGLSYLMLLVLRPVPAFSPLAVYGPCRQVVTGPTQLYLCPRGARGSGPHAWAHDAHGWVDAGPLSPTPAIPAR